MNPSRPRSLWLAGSGLALAFSVPAVAQQAEQCGQRLDEIEEQVSQADLAEQRRGGLRQIVSGARALAEAGDQEGCMRMAAGLSDLVAALEQRAGPGAAGQEQAQTEGQQNAGQSAQQTQAGGQQPSASAKEQLPEQTAKGQEPKQTDQGQAQTGGQRAEDAGSSRQQAQADSQQDARQSQQQTQAGGQQPSASAKEQLPEQTAEGQEPRETEQGQAQTGGQRAEDADTAQQHAQPGGQQGKQDAEQPSQEQAASDQQPGQQAATEEQQPAQEQAASESPLTGRSPNELLGAEVVNDEGDSVAEIVDLEKKKDAEGLYAVLSVGGFLGIGDKQVAVAADRFRSGEGDQLVLTNASEEEIESMPPYQEAEYESTLPQQPAGGEATGGSEQPPAAAQ
jgi:hypothetical protein